MRKTIEAITDLQETIKICQGGIKDKEKQLVKELIAYREARNISQRQMAYKLNISAGYMGDIELGRRRLSEKILEKLYDL